jgi:TnpA family transposase
MATIKLRYSSASQLFKRLSSYALDHPLYQALKEFGRIIKSQYILTYLDDVELRQPPAATQNPPLMATSKSPT